MATQTGTPNILLLIADDLGEGSITITGAGLTRAIEVHSIDINQVNIVGALPNVSRFLRNGLYFSQAWAQPACSPTRASIYTGLHPWKDGGQSDRNSATRLSAGFSTLPNLLPADYVSGLFGKWHLGSVAGTRLTDHGWDRFVGTLGGAARFLQPEHRRFGYQHVPVNLDAVANPTDYATLRTVNEAAADQRSDPDVPWFATVAFQPARSVSRPAGRYDCATAGTRSCGSVEPGPLRLHVQHHDAERRRQHRPAARHRRFGRWFALFLDPIPED